MTLRTFNQHQQAAESTLLFLEKSISENARKDAKSYNNLHLWITFYIENQSVIFDRLTSAEITKIRDLALRTKNLATILENSELINLSKRLNVLFQNIYLANPKRVIKQTPIQLMDLPLDVLFMIFNYAINPKKQMDLTRVSKRVYSLLHNRDLWVRSGAFRNLTSSSGAGIERKDFTKLLVHLHKISTSSQLSKQLAQAFFNEASDHTLLLYLNSLSPKDREFVLSLVDGPLHRKTLSLSGYKDISSPSLGLSWFVARMPLLETLDLSYNLSLSDQDLSLVGTLTQLEFLSLSSCKNLTGIGLVKLSLLTEKLRTLKISSCNNLEPHFFKELSSLKNLRTLDLQDSRSLKDADLAFLQALSNLESLNLSKCPLITDESLRPLVYLQGTLKTLVLNTTNINGCGLRHISHSLALTSLNLENCTKLTDAGFEEVILPSLRDLNLNKCSRITGKCFSAISQWKQLQILNCQNLTNLHDNQLAHLNFHPALRYLDLSFGFKFTKESVGPLIQSLTHLETLQISNCPMLVGLLIDYLPINSKLRELNLSYSQGNKIGPFASLGNPSEMKVLKLNGCSLDKNDLEQLSKAAQLSIEHLEISDCPKINDDALTALPTSLSKLSIRDNQHITDQGVLAIIQKLPRLTFLDVSNSLNLTEGGIRAIVSLKPKLILKYQLSYIPGYVSMPKNQIV